MIDPILKELGPDWSLQRRIATEAIHAMGCLGWKPMEGTPGFHYHLCRSVAGNVCAALYGQKQLVEDDFRNPLATSYDPNLDESICECGHTYYRHFDTYDEMSPVGCKYCACWEFKLKVNET